VKIPASVLINRIDSVGDVVLALPVAGMLKRNFPGIKVGLLASSYTKAIADACVHIDEFVDVEDYIKGEVFICGKKPTAILHLVTNEHMSRRAKELDIPLRIGTMSRLHHWRNCNKLLWLSRRGSQMHDARANLSLLRAFGINKHFSFDEIASLYGLEKLQPLEEKYKNLLQPQKVNVVMHPKSQGNAREWPIRHFIDLINLLDPHQYNVLVSGVASEKAFVDEIEVGAKRPIVNLAGQISLGQFISFINAADVMICNSTGPLHLAAALGKHAFGIYPALTHRNPVRWAPIGKSARTFVFQDDCKECEATPNHCRCIAAIQPLEIKEALDELKVNKTLNTLASW